MAASPVNPLAFIWRSQGLEWLFAPDGAAGRRVARSAGEAAAGKASGSGTAAAPVRPAPERRPPRPAQPVAPSAPKRGDVPAWPADCPREWAGLMARSRPSRVLWTYFGLGDDMLGADPGRAARGGFLRRLLADLGHPRGTHGFWPMAIAGKARPDLFYAGAARLGARGAVVFGSRAACGLELAGARPLLQMRAHGLLIQILWELDALMRQEKNYDAALAFLRQALAPLVRGCPLSK